MWLYERLQRWPLCKVHPLSICSGSDGVELSEGCTAIPPRVFFTPMGLFICTDTLLCISHHFLSCFFNGELLHCLYLSAFAPDLSWRKEFQLDRANTECSVHVDFWDWNRRDYICILDCEDSTSTGCFEGRGLVR